MKHRMYEKVLLDLLKDKTDVIGIAYVINGRVEGAEVFACKSLCEKQWPKMLKSCVVDALVCQNDKLTVEKPSAATVEDFLKRATGPVVEIKLPSEGEAVPQQNATSTTKGKRSEVKMTATVSIYQCDQKESLMVESRDKEPAGAVYIAAT
jgi:hypothetical protein